MLKLTHVKVQNFRSIVDSTRVDIEDGVSVLIGKNEQGKTNFLKGMASFGKERTYSARDLPNHLRPQLESAESLKFPIVTLWFRTDESSIAELKKIANKIEAGDTLKCAKYFDNSYQFWICRGQNEEEVEIRWPDVSEQINTIRNLADDFYDHLSEHCSRLPEYGKKNGPTINHLFKDFRGADFPELKELESAVATLFAALRGLPGEDAAVQETINKYTEEINLHLKEIRPVMEKQQLNVLLEDLPVFIYHSSTADKIPDSVQIDAFANNAHSVPRGILNLCQIAGLSAENLIRLTKIKSPVERQTYEDHYTGTVSGTINKYWTQQQYEIHFRIDPDTLSVSISDDTYNQRIAPSNRSDGFQWYLSFYSTLLTDISGKRPAILLLDNPGLELHADGQRDIKKTLEEMVSSGTQIIYITHSSAMIDPFNCDQIIKVELLPSEKGSIVSRISPGSDPASDLLEPVRSAIGASLVSSLIFNHFDILVEGAADKPIMDAAVSLIDSGLRERVCVNGSLSESKDAFLADFYRRSGLPFVTVLDADDGGRKLRAELKRKNIPEDRIIDLKQIFPEMQGDFALEDVLSDDFYYKAVKEAYPGKKIEKVRKSNKKIANEYEAQFREKAFGGFSKKRVAEKVRALVESHNIDQKSSENLNKIMETILAKFSEKDSEKKAEQTSRSGRQAPA